MCIVAFQHARLPSSLLHRRPTSQGNSDWNGEDTLLLNVTDLGNVGIGEPLSAFVQVLITVSPVNDPPEVTFDLNGVGVLPSGGALGVDEDTPLLLALLSINDREMSAGEGGRLTVSLQCSNGGFRIVPEDSGEVVKGVVGEVVWAVGGLAKGAGLGPWQVVAFAGGLIEINQVLGRLEYLPGLDWHGVDDLRVSSSAIYRITCTFPRRRLLSGRVGQNKAFQAGRWVGRAAIGDAMCVVRLVLSV